MNNEPLVSVVTATYNMEHFLAAAIRSVRDQGYRNLQHIIIDDGSTDGTAELVDGFSDDGRLEYHRQPNQGQTVAKNNGIKLAKGEFVCFLDADNIWELDKLERQLAAFRTLGADHGIVYTDQDCIDNEGNFIYLPEVERFSGNITTRLLFENFVTFNTAMVRQSCFDEAGLMDEDLARSIDYELWLRFSTKFKFHYLPGVTTHYRLWEGQMSDDKERRFRYTFRIIEKFARDNPEHVPAPVLRKAWGRTLASRGRYRSSAGEFRAAAGDYLAALRHDPLSLYTWKSFFRMLLLRS